MRNRIELRQEMLKWQLKKLIQHFILLQDHSTDQSCPCELALSEQEKCIPKHLTAIEAYATETIPMTDNPELKEALRAIAGGASDLLRDIWGKEVVEYPEIEAWAREMRKKLEPFFFEQKVEQGGDMISKRIRELYQKAPRYSELVRKLYLKPDDVEFRIAQYQETPLDKAVYEVRRILYEKGTIDPEDIKKVADKYGIPYDRLIREALKGLKYEKIDETYRLVVPPVKQAQRLREFFGVILRPDEVEAIDPKTGKRDFPEKLERCVLHVFGGLPEECREAIETGKARYDPKQKRVVWRDTGKPIPDCYNPYAVCRASLRRYYGLPIMVEEEEELKRIEIIHKEEVEEDREVLEIEKELREKGVIF